MPTVNHNAQAEVILDQLNVVKLDINIWTGSKKLRSEDLVLADGSKLPPDELAYLGTKKTIDPERLREFNRIKKEAERVCLEVGTRFLGGFANPEESIPDVIDALDKLKAEFYDAKKDFLAGYEADTDAWVQKYPDFGQAIRRAIEPAASVANKLNFDYVVFRVVMPTSKNGDDSDGAVDAVKDDSLIRRTNSMSEQLFREIAQDASQLVDKSFVGKDCVTARSLSAFRRMRDKLDNLGFLDHRCLPVVDKIDSVLDTLPDQGPFNGSAFNDLFALGLLLSDPEKIKRHGSGLLSPNLFPESDEDQEDTEEGNNLPLVEEEPDPEVTPQSTVSPSVPDGQSPAAASTSQPEVESAETNTATAVVNDSAAEAGLEDDDDLPGFDAFLSTYQQPADVFEETPPANHNLDLDLDRDVFKQEHAGEDRSAAPAPVVEEAKPAESVSSPLGNQDSDEDAALAVLMNPTSESAVIEQTDFWF